VIVIEFNKMLTSTGVYLTELRATELKQELLHLKQIKSPELSRRIKEAREMGNHEENDLLYEVLEQQEELSKRIREIENLLITAQVISGNIQTELTSVAIGCTVVVEVEGRLDTFKIVGVDEAAPLQGKISNHSPVGKALIGCGKGQEVLVETEVYSTIYKVVDIKNE
jgi:transcription elongation factor GreA